jgi:oxygen-independent coproporphyrinogen-3 oxidase
MDRKDLEQLFESLRKDDRLNTSYPLSVADWKPYQVNRSLLFTDEEPLAFYLHIPFCRHLCTFCEYCRMPLPGEADQQHYLRTLKKDIQRFCEQHSSLTLYGFDIGGGTPTALSDECFAQLMNIYADTLQRVHTTADYEPSIEATFATLTDAKIHSMVEAGIRRVSLGIQTTDAFILRQTQRGASSLSTMNRWIDKLHQAGIQKVNVDMMYGLQGQTQASIGMDLDILKALNVEQVTLYEFRPNMTHYHSDVDKDVRFVFYSTLYEGLKKMGYHARFGCNTFSKNRTDMGTSSYLRHRMLEGASYKGFGLSAQSMSLDGVSYNIGKLVPDIASFLHREDFAEAYTYHLPIRERFAKFVAISAYSGSLSLKHASYILQTDIQNVLSQRISFLLEEGLFTKEDDTLYITENGFRDYGAAFGMLIINEL